MLLMLDLLSIDLVVFSMRTDKSYVYHSELIVYFHNYPVFIPLNIEHYSALLKNARACIHGLYFRWLIPVAFFHLAIPCQQRLLALAACWFGRSARARASRCSSA